MKTYKIREFAKILNISDQTLRNYDKKGVFVPYKLPSGHRYYTEKHIDEAISKGMVVDFNIKGEIDGRKEEKV